LIERAHAYRSTQQQALQDLLARLDDRDRRDAERASLIERRDAESAGLLARAEAELTAAETAARETVARAKAESQRLIGEIRRAVNEEWERLRQGEKTRAALERTRRNLKGLGLAQGVEAVSAPRDAAGDSRAAQPGDQVEVSHLGLRGEILVVEGGSATVRAGTLTVKFPLQALRITRAGSSVRHQDPASAGPREARGWEEGVKGTVPVEVHLIGRTGDEARDLLEKYLDDAFLAGLTSVRIIHGKGTGTLRRVVEDVLSGHPLVAEHRLGAPHEGGSGATVAVLSQT
jgi:DNA mismatch repair protein MutS2